MRKTVQLDKKTMELLLVNYHNINNSMLKPCADKTKFINLIADLEIQIKKAGRTVVYSDGLSALEFANKLAKEANKKYNIVPKKKAKKRKTKEKK